MARTPCSCKLRLKVRHKFLDSAHYCPYALSHEAADDFEDMGGGIVRALVTGGAGFIGSHLCRLLVSEGHSVGVIDDLSTGNMDNLKGVQGSPGFIVHRDTILNRELLQEETAKSDVVFHLAAAVGVRLIIDDPVRTIRTNIDGTAAVLDAASKGDCKVVLASSSEVYGKGVNEYFGETDDLILGPTNIARWSYACSKAVDEFLGLAYGKQFNVPVVIVRLFNTVGPGQSGRYGMVVPTFVKQAMADEPITVYGDGTQSRCFAHVDDVVKAIVKLSSTKEAVGRVINLGNDVEVSINELAKRVRDMAGSNSDVVLVPYSEAYEEGFEDLQRRKPCLDVARKLICYVPEKALDDILSDIIGYERNRT